MTRRPSPLDRLSPVRERMLVFGAPDLRDAEIDEVLATMRSGWIGTGPRTARFEADFARYQGVDSAVAVSSCTAALMLALQALRIRPGDEVVTTPLTFCATANAILHAGARPVLADVEDGSQNIDPVAIADAITPRTRAVLIVHFAGHPCDMDRILEVTEARGVDLVEDCAHAIETRWDGRPAGTFGRFGCFSFYATKNVTTAEGGMVVGRNSDDLDRIKMLALHGLSHDAWKRFGDEGYEHYAVLEAGYKCNMTDLQAAIGIHQLARVESALRRREEIWATYDRAFADLPITRPALPPDRDRHARHLYAVRVDADRCGIDRDTFVGAMTRQNIGVGVHYLSLPEHPFYQRELGWSPERWPRSTRIGRETVSLPMSPALTEADVQHVILAVRRALGDAT